VRAVVITGAGGNFCSGGDVHEIIGRSWPRWTCRAAALHAHDRRPGEGDARLPAADHRRGRRRVRRRRRDHRHGLDLRFGTPEAKTAFLFVRVGLAGCDMGACAILPRIIGQGRASELLYTAAR
jgi:enoyl-CoA hydratase/carnithine racemase